MEGSTIIYDSPLSVGVLPAIKKGTKVTQMETTGGGIGDTVFISDYTTSIESLRWSLACSVVILIVFCFRNPRSPDT